jgi:hypothetical protein
LHYGDINFGLPTYRDIVKNYPHDQLCLQHLAKKNYVCNIIKKNHVWDIYRYIFFFQKKNQYVFFFQKINPYIFWSSKVCGSIKKINHAFLSQSKNYGPRFQTLHLISFFEGTIYFNNRNYCFPQFTKRFAWYKRSKLYSLKKIKGIF